MRDQRQLAAVIEILEIERETWRQVCAQLGAAPQAGDAGTAAAELDSASSERSAPHAGARPFAPHGLGRFEAGPPVSGFTASA
jgi:hypothetical protein